MEESEFTAFLDVELSGLAAAAQSCSSVSESCMDLRRPVVFGGRIGVGGVWYSTFPNGHSLTSRNDTVTSARYSMRSWRSNACELWMHSRAFRARSPRRVRRGWFGWQHAHCASPPSPTDAQQQPCGALSRSCAVRPEHMQASGQPPASWWRWCTRHCSAK
jgi:hypothetical protein